MSAPPTASMTLEARLVVDVQEQVAKPLRVSKNSQYQKDAPPKESPREPEPPARPPPRLVANGARAALRGLRSLSPALQLMQRLGGNALTPRDDSAEPGTPRGERVPISEQLPAVGGVVPRTPRQPPTPPRSARRPAPGGSATTSEAGSNQGTSGGSGLTPRLPSVGRPSTPACVDPASATSTPQRTPRELPRPGGSSSGGQGALPHPTAPQSARGSAQRRPSQSPSSSPAPNSARETRERGRQPNAPAQAPNMRSAAVSDTSGKGREMAEVQVHVKKLLNAVYSYPITEEAAVSIVEAYPELGWLAQCIRRCPLPPCWSTVDGQNGDFDSARYVNTEGGDVTDSSPTMEHFVEMARLMLQWRESPREVVAVGEALKKCGENAKLQVEHFKRVWNGPHVDPATGAEFWHFEATGTSTWGDPCASAEFIARVADRLQKALPAPAPPMPPPEVVQTGQQKVVAAPETEAPQPATASPSVSPQIPSGERPGSRRMRRRSEEPAQECNEDPVTRAVINARAVRNREEALLRESREQCENISSGRALSARGARDTYKGKITEMEEEEAKKALRTLRAARNREEALFQESRKRCEESSGVRALSARESRSSHRMEEEATLHEVATAIRQDLSRCQKIVQDAQNEAAHMPRPGSSSGKSFRRRRADSTERRLDPIPLGADGKPQDQFSLFNGLLEKAAARCGVAMPSESTEGDSAKVAKGSAEPLAPLQQGSAATPADNMDAPASHDDAATAPPSAASVSGAKVEKPMSARGAARRAASAAAAARAAEASAEAKATAASSAATCEITTTPAATAAGAAAESEPANGQESAAVAAPAVAPDGESLCQSTHDATNESAAVAQDAQTKSETTGAAAVEDVHDVQTAPEGKPSTTAESDAQGEGAPAPQQPLLQNDVSGDTEDAPPRSPSLMSVYRPGSPSSPGMHNGGDAPDSPSIIILEEPPVGKKKLRKSRSERTLATASRGVRFECHKPAEREHVAAPLQSNKLNRTVTPPQAEAIIKESEAMALKSEGTEIQGELKEGAEVSDAAVPAAAATAATAAATLGSKPAMGSRPCGRGVRRVAAGGA
eukprot:gnl/TRDRNA2_/TRDRNA2_81202_c0_seq1.p1 gnl/TRDRNA2_/TRDRNA2_81202_c0~~gnl/TRDRNA2_/TRDRNA2_81202_c0_seq1.p1  ORF type:complete len:1106 (+),score=208.42 gnl/TRDRNA2_/TRDRNA2_81202_c0_seq1:90-3320(+)